jgi:hypothetical protein
VRGRDGVGRRAVLRGAVALPLVLASCTSTPTTPPAPDPLAELAGQARADANAADAIAKAVPPLAAAAGEVSTARSAHALALQKEVDRERPPIGSSTPRPETSAPPAPADPAAAKTALVTALSAAEQRIGELIGTVPRYRAGLLGSVAAGCASLREVLA